MVIGEWVIGDGVDFTHHIKFHRLRFLRHQFPHPYTMELYDGCNGDITNPNVFRRGVNNGDGQLGSGNFEQQQEILIHHMLIQSLSVQCWLGVGMVIGA